MQIQFIRMVKFKFFAQFPVDRIHYPIESGLILSLCDFAEFTYAIDRFVILTI